MKTCIFHLNNLTALHVGTGQGVGVVDLPIARSKATNLPIVPGSAIKGVLRDELKEKLSLENKDINILFGKDKDADHAGAVAFGDANLLILPIRSFAGTVAYATCPYILKQYQRDVASDLKTPDNLKDTAHIANDSVLVVKNNKIALEDLDIDSKSCQVAHGWAKFIAKQLYPDSVANAQSWRDEFIKRFVVLPNNIFSFLADTATEIRTRIRIDRETRIVQEGALWTEENLPAESVLWGVLGVSQSRDGSGKKAEALVQLLPKDEITIQLGGKHTVGRGFCRLLIDNQGE
ncbi:MAG: type III-B CRISPR module RAMP protein Cmr4 [Moraxella sp.]|nr:type III-B CRISPR module RAMP protein Cmr4 [Moraxella sp.]